MARILTLLLHWLLGNWLDLDFAPVRVLVSLGSLLCYLLAICCSAGSRLCSFSVVGLARIVTLPLSGYLVIVWISTLLLCVCWSRSARYSAPPRLFGVRSDLDFAPFRLFVSLGSLLCSFTGYWVPGRISTLHLLGCWVRSDRYLAPYWLFGVRSDLDFAPFRLLV